MASNKKREISEWYEQYSDSIFKYVSMMTHDYQLAEDLTQETFIKAYKHLDTFMGEAQPRTWLFSIARNLTIDYIRKQKPINLFKDLLLLKNSSNAMPDEIVEIKENSKELYHALAKLKPAYREVIILRKIKEFSILETMEILGWSEGKVKTTLYRAIHALEEQLIKEGFGIEA